MFCKIGITFLIMVFSSKYVPSESHGGHHGFHGGWHGSRGGCSNTTIDVDLNNVTAKYETFGAAMDGYWKSGLIPLSPLGIQTVDNMLRIYHSTDSLELKDQIWVGTLYTLGTEPWIDPNNGDYCIDAGIINATATYIVSGDNSEFLANVGNMINYTEITCPFAVIRILRDMGCKKLPILKHPYCNQTSRCFERGLVYQIDIILKSRGELLPCSYRQQIKSLYESDDPRDKGLGIALVMGVLNINAAEAFNVVKLLEIMHDMSGPRDGICCCKIKRTRLLELCQNFALTNLDPMLNAFTTQCPPDAAYQR